MRLDLNLITTQNCTLRMWLLFLFAATFVGRLQYWHHLQRHHSAHQRLLNFKPSAASWLFFGFKVVLKPVEEAQQLSEKKPRKEASELLIARLLTRMSAYNGPKYWVVTISLLLSHSFTCCICALFLEWKLYRSDPAAAKEWSRLSYSRVEWNEKVNVTLIISDGRFTSAQTLPSIA